MKAPSITPQEIAAILSASEIQVSTIFDKVTLVACRLPSGFVLTASSGAVSKENYDEAVGAEICMKKIEDQLWKLEGYALQKAIASDLLGCLSHLANKDWFKDKSRTGEVICGLDADKVRNALAKFIQTTDH